ncbi:MAG TPA: hypothetical protein VMB26_14540 [Candidatus Binataceae bacterium]|nr:hypothetical protein [Candidatus Binataceae bacterium]
MNRVTAMMVVVLSSSALTLGACASQQQIASPTPFPTIIKDPSVAASSKVSANQVGEAPTQAQPAPPPSQLASVAPTTAPSKNEPDSVLEIAPAQLPAAFTPPSSNPSDPNAAPDAGSAQDYLNTQKPASTEPLPNFAGIDDYMNQEANYEAVGSGLPASAFMPPVGFAPYYYPYFVRTYYPVYFAPPIVFSQPLPASYLYHPLPPLAPLPRAFSHPYGGGIHLGGFHGGRR